MRRDEVDSALTENDLRPKDLEAGKLKALQIDLERLSALKADFVWVRCPACDQTSGEFEFEKYGFKFVRCHECLTVYMNPRPTPQILAEFYANSALYEYWDQYIFPASRSSRQKRIFRPRVERILQICGDRGLVPDVLIEVGAAGGMFCEEALRSGGFGRVVGIEPSSAQAATCRALGIEVWESVLERATDFEVTAQVVVSFETIEHVFSPRAFLQSCYSLLEAGGILAITCPNYMGFDITELGTLSESLDAEHINLFNPKSLRKLVESCGFEVVELSTPGELDAELVRNKVIEGTRSLDKQPFLSRVLLDEWDRLGGPFQDFLKDQCLSSNMWLVARRSV